MKRVKKRIFYGAICEQEVYTVGDGSYSLQRRKPRFQNEEERRLHREHVAWRRYYRTFMANFDRSSLYSTLTFDRFHEILTGWEAEEVKRRFVRRLRHRNLNAQILLHIGLGDRGRIHFHMVSNGLSAEEILSAWTWGTNNDCKQLWGSCKDEQGNDIGADYIGLARYLFEHRTPDKTGGRRYYATKNLKKPDEEEPVETIRIYSLEKPPRPPKGYRLISATANRFGYLSFKYVLETTPEKTGKASFGTPGEKRIRQQE